MNKLQWKRPYRETLATGTVRRRWRTRCNRFVVEEHKHAGLSTVFLAIATRGSDELLISRHRTRQAAQRTCEHAAKGGDQ